MMMEGRVVPDTIMQKTIMIQLNDIIASIKTLFFKVFINDKS